MRCAASCGLAGLRRRTEFQAPAAPAATGYGRRAHAGTDQPQPRAPAAARSASSPAWTSRASGGPCSDRPSSIILVEQALKANPDVGAAQAALRQAHELYSAQRTSFFPNVQGSFSGYSSQERPRYHRQSDQPAASEPLLQSVYGPAQRELSPGCLRRHAAPGRNRQGAEPRASRFQLEATYLTLSSNVVVTAVQEASLRGQIAATMRLARAAASVDRQGSRSNGCSAPRAIWMCSRKQSAEAQTAQTLPPLQKQLGQTRDALTALLGRLPSEEPEETFRLEDLTLPTDLPVSLPSKLIEQRPDVRQAEENMHAASAAVGVAIADLLPQFTIDGNLGSTALKLGDLFSPYTGFWRCGRVADRDAVRCRRAACTRSARRTPHSIRRGRNIAPPSFSPARMWRIRLRALQADADALKASAEAERAAKATFDLAQRQRALGTISLVAVLERGASLPASGIGAGRRRRRIAMPTRPACFRRSAAVGGIVRRSLAMNSLVRRENSGGAATLTLNRPEKLNALSKEVFEALGRARGCDRARDQENRPRHPARRRREFLGGLRHGRGPRARQGARQAAFPLGSHPEDRESAAAGDLRRAGSLLDRSPGARAGGGPDRRCRIGAVLRRLRALGPDAGVGLEPAAAAPHRHGQSERNDVHLPHLFGTPGRGHAPRQFLLSGRAIRCGARRAVRGHPEQFLVREPGEQARADRNRRFEPARRPRARAVQERRAGAGCGETDREILRDRRTFGWLQLRAVRPGALTPWGV